MATVRFEHFRVSLFEREQKSLFIEENRGKTDFLNSIFSEKREFHSGSITYSYVLCSDLGGGQLVGKTGRQFHQGENLSPEEGYLEVEHSGHKASIIAINVIDGVDGQKISFQIDHKVGRPSKILDAFAQSINSTRPNSHYLIQFHAIVDESTFWGFVEDNDKQIVSLRLDYVVPNGIWSLDKSIRDEIKYAGEQISAQNLTTIASNPDGINIASKQVREAVDYAASGSGDISAKAKNGKKYNSRDKTKKTILTIANEKKKMIDHVTDEFLRVMGYEQ